MEEVAMEKAWENFWQTGKITDYLAYRNQSSESLSSKEQKKQTGYGTVRNTYRDGADRNAHRGI